MLSARAILEFLDVPTSSAWNLTPAQALAFLKSKGLQLSFNWQDMLASEHTRAFTVAKMMDTDLLATVKASLEDALASGATFKEWSDTITPTLQAAGWWGRKAVLAPTGQTIVAQLGSPSRLQTVYRSNMASAYAAGQWDGIVAQSQLAPYLMYDAVNDARTRPQHHAWDNTVLNIDDPWWQTHYPPNGWNCRCTVIQLSADDCASMGLPTYNPPPSEGTYKWTSPTGKTLKVPDGVDPGWDINAGEDLTKSLAKMVADKLAGYDAAMQAAAAVGMEATAQAASASLPAEIASAKQAIGKTLTPAEIKLVATATEEKAAAAKMSQHLAANTPYMASAIKSVQASKAGQALTAVEQHKAAEVVAAKTKASADLAHYKQAILKGKEPPAAAKAAFEALPDEAAVAIKEQLQAQLAEKATQKAAQAELDAIASHPTTLKAKTLAKAMADSTTEAMKPTELLASVLQHVAQLNDAAAAKKAAKSTAAKLDSAAAKLKEGKQLSEAEHAAIKSLSTDEANAWATSVKQAQDAAAAAHPVTTMKAGKSLLHPEPEISTDALIDKMIEGEPLTDAEVATLKAAGVDAASYPLGEAALPGTTTVQSTGPIAIHPDKMTKIGPQTGTNPGGLYLDQDTGVKWYIKTPASVEQARNEVLAGKLYELAGVEVPELRLIEFQGKPSVASRLIDDLTMTTPAKLAKATGTLDSFATDAWLGNWDVIGANFDNLKLKGARAIHVDTGGAMRYRAMGTAKGDAWGPTVTELDSLRNAATNPQAAAVFGKITEAQMKASATKLLAIDRDQVAKLVDEFGPTGNAERATLKKTLLARLDSIEEQLKLKPPEVKPAPVITKGGKRVSAADINRIVESKANGYTLSSDGGAIEDHQVLLQHFTDKAGVAKTRMVVKLREAGAKDAERRMSKAAGQAFVVDFQPVRDSVVALAKSINVRAAKAGAKVDKTIFDKHMAYIHTRQDAYIAMRALPAETDAVRAAKAVLDEMDAALSKADGGGIIGTPLKAVPLIKTSKLVDIVVRTPGKSVEGGITWQRISDFNYRIASYRKGRITETAEVARLPDTRSVMVGKRSDGTLARYAMQNEENSIASRGLLHIEVKGQGVAAAEQAMDVLESLGVVTTTTNTGERLGLYLDKIANVRFLREDGKAAQYAALAKVTNEEARNAAKLKLLSTDTGYDLTKSPYWNPDGQYQAFGHGRTVFMRPDLDTGWDTFNGAVTVYTNVTGLSVGASSSQWRALKRIFDSGGTLSSQVERARRGLSMTAQTADWETGGANYVYTRILASNSKAPGVYFKPRVLKRVDAFSYDRDMYGAVDREKQIEGRKVDLDGMRANLRNGSNETNFRDGLSLFDDLDRIIFKTDAERVEALQYMRANGHATWPDGRKLEEVLLGPQQ